MSRSLALALSRTTPSLPAPHLPCHVESTRERGRYKVNPYGWKVTSLSPTFCLAERQESRGARARPTSPVRPISAHGLHPVSPLLLRVLAIGWFPKFRNLDLPCGNPLLFHDLLLAASSACCCLVPACCAFVTRLAPSSFVVLSCSLLLERIAEWSTLTPSCCSFVALRRCPATRSDPEEPLSSYTSILGEIGLRVGVP